MKERPILFQGAMVRALLADLKTQTRRVVKPQPDAVNVCMWNGWPHAKSFDGGRIGRTPIPCPYGQPGDRLWVRETARCIGQSTDFSSRKVRFDVDYKAKGGTSFHFDLDAEPRWFPRVTRNTDGSPRWQPGIHMPRWASRILLEVTGVRVERLQDISEADAKAEGCSYPLAYEGPDSPYRTAYARLWESINGVGGWDANPWVWVISFRRNT